MCWLTTVDPPLVAFSCSFGRDTYLEQSYTVREGADMLTLWELQQSYKHDQVLSHRPPGDSLGELCVLFQSSKLLGLGSPLSAYHSATLMATWTLKLYSGLLRGAGGGAGENVSLALLCTAGGHSAILLLHKRLLQVPVWQWPLDHWSIMIAS